ncbi:MAG: SDR family oxidoreductase [Bacilli bacterium]|nr:SDR family oxidoreductase [Bacilli bacterium]MDD4406707.1 SDR family oxidoreductase [Bacilli bacterium]
MKIALITGASSGIGKDMALYLNDLNYKLILVGRNKEKLIELKKVCSNATVIICDLSSKEEVYKLYLKNKNINIDLLINNAGFGLFGFFNKTDLETELKMINVNVIATHMLTKLFLKDFIKRDKGHILNVSSSAGFMAGPYLNTYYATKNYILKLTLALYEELKRQKSNVKVSVLCPGPVNTNFNNVAGGSFNVKGLSSEYVAKYALNLVFKNKLIIIPSFKMKLGIFLTRLIPIKLLLKITYVIQKNKFR